MNGPIRLDVELQNCEIRKMSEIERWANRWRAVADERRLRLLRLCADGPATVSALATATGDSEPNVSRQLKQLATAGLVERSRQGQFVEYVAARGDDEAGRAATWLVAQLSDDDAPLREARLALQRARQAEPVRGTPLRAPAPASRFGRALQAALRLVEVAGPGARVLLRSPHPEVLESLARRGLAVTWLAAGTADVAPLRRHALQQGLEVDVELAPRLAARRAGEWDLVVLDGSLAPPAGPEADLELARRLLAPRGTAWVIADYDALEPVAGGAAPPQRLRGLMLAAGLDCQELVPVEAAGRHVLAARSTPLRPAASLARSA